MILAFGGSEAMAQRYRSMSCGELWYARNAIYADAGYCFESRRAIRTFGRGCFPPYGKLRPVERRQVEAIKRWERRKGCR
ncbi:YARHG domain-containing protein [Jiella sp. LLJ827]|uniref:YARHG domain-containing protein n=1 Tax=Jiella sp. LLJ827 TaxID=2917712 RepID=UPI0021008547|nr:YARHG domain-containing protein [Jiella sp. LLJ827]MCQ0989336.1 YARHG domain-containing protein [Jiella sp. LLJ827]